MKSNFFKVSDFHDSEKFKKDIGNLCELTSDIIGQLPILALQVFEVPTQKEVVKIHEASAERLGIPLSRLIHALSVTSFFMRAFAHKGDAAMDEVSDIFDDLTGLFSIPENKYKGILLFLKETKRLAREKIYPILLRQTLTQSTVPILSSVSTVTDFRAIFDELYEYDMEIEEYKPKFMGTLPIGIVKLKLDGTHANEVFFQVSKRSLQILIDSLLALQKNIVSAEKEINK